MRHLFCGVLLLVATFGFLRSHHVVADDPTSAIRDGQMLFEREWEWWGPVRQLSEKDIHEHLADFRKHQRGRFPQRPFQESLPGDGLGPLHNATSCAQCHVQGGGSGVQQNVTLLTIDPRSDFLAKRVRVIDAYGTARFQRSSNVFEDRDVLGKGIHEQDKNDERKENQDENQDGESIELLMRFFPNVLSSRVAMMGELDSVTGLSFNTVVHDRSTVAGYDQIKNRLREFIPGGGDDKWFVPQQRTSAAVASQPVVAGRFESIDYYLSQRNAPALWGLGAIESIESIRLHRIAKRQRIESKGKISGRVAGKFGWRGQLSTVSEFVSAACASELGLNDPAGISQPNDPTNPGYRNTNPDVSPVQLAALSTFVSSLPRPIENPEPEHSTRIVLQGERAFRSVGCSVCHVAEIHPVSGIFSDLLLHDMGEELQAPFPAPIIAVGFSASSDTDLSTVESIVPITFGQSPFKPTNQRMGFYGSPTRSLLPLPFAASKPDQPTFPRIRLSAEQLAGPARGTWDDLQREWKTPPLWGVADTAPYLHDGRAETIREAILMHGGEALDSRDAFESLDASSQEKLIAFLRSLKAPKISMSRLPEPE